MGGEAESIQRLIQFFVRAEEAVLAASPATVKLIRDWGARRPLAWHPVTLVAQLQASSALHGLD